MIDRTYAERLTASILTRKEKDYPDTRLPYLPFVTDFEQSRERLLGDVLFELWDTLMANYKAYEQGRPLLLSEKALACLIRRGVPRNSIMLQGPRASFSLPAFSYFVNKEGAACSVGPRVVTSRWKFSPLRWVRLSGEELSEFIFDFDSLVGFVTESVDSLLLNVKLRATQYEIICRTVGELGETFLKPHGIHWNVGEAFSVESVPVMFQDGIHEDYFESIPMDRLSEVIRGIPELMEGRPKLKRADTHRFGFWCDGSYRNI